jgi:hypothetical protein
MVVLYAKKNISWQNFFYFGSQKEKYFFHPVDFTHQCYIFYSFNIIIILGYLIDEPSPFEYTSNDEESASESNAASSDNEEDNKKKKRKKSDNESSEEENLGTLISELDGLNKDNDNMVNIWLQRSERNKRRKENVEDDSAAPVSSLMLLDNGDGEGSEDDDWVPGDKRKLKKKQKVEKKEPMNSESKKEDIDSNNSPSKLDASKSKQKNSKRKSSDSKGKEVENSSCDKDMSQDSKLNNEVSEQDVSNTFKA